MRKPKSTTMDLCTPCREEIKADGREVTLAQGGVNQKITCAACGKRRYGATYCVSKGVTK